MTDTSSKIVANPSSTPKSNEQEVLCPPKDESCSKASSSNGDAYDLTNSPSTQTSLVSSQDSSDLKVTSKSSPSTTDTNSANNPDNTSSSAKINHPQKTVTIDGKTYHLLDILQALGSSDGYYTRSLIPSAHGKFNVIAQELFTFLDQLLVCTYFAVDIICAGLNSLLKNSEDYIASIKDSKVNEIHKAKVAKEASFQATKAYNKAQRNCTKAEKNAEAKKKKIEDCEVAFKNAEEKAKEASEQAAIAKAKAKDASQADIGVAQDAAKKADKVAKDAKQELNKAKNALDRAIESAKNFEDKAQVAREALRIAKEAKEAAKIAAEEAELAVTKVMVRDAEGYLVEPYVLMEQAVGLNDLVYANIAYAVRNHCRVEVANVVICKDKLAKADKKLKASESKVNKAEVSLNESQVKLKEAETLLGKVNVSPNATVGDINKAKQELDEANKELNKANEDLAQAKSDLNKAKEVFETAKNNLAEAEDKLAKLGGDCTLVTEVDSVSDKTLPLIDSNACRLAIEIAVQSIKTRMTKFRMGKPLSAQSIKSKLKREYGLTYRSQDNNSGFRVEPISVDGKAKLKLLLPATIGKAICNRDPNVKIQDEGHQRYSVELDVPQDEYWADFHKDPEKVLKDLKYVSVCTFYDGEYRKRFKVVFTFKGTPPLTDGMIRWLIENGYDPQSKADMDRYFAQTVGIDQGKESFFCFNGKKLECLANFPDYYQFQAAVRYWQRRLDVELRRVNPDKYNSDKTVKPRAEYNVPFKYDDKAIAVLESLRSAQYNLARARKESLRRIANRIAGLGGCVHLENMKWFKNYFYQKTRSFQQDQLDSKKSSKDVQSESKDTISQATANKNKEVDAEHGSTKASSDKKKTESSSEGFSSENSVISIGDSSQQKSQPEVSSAQSNQPESQSNSENSKPSKASSTGKQHPSNAKVAKQCPALAKNLYVWRLNGLGKTPLPIPCILGATNYFYPCPENEQFREKYGRVQIKHNYTEVYLPDRQQWYTIQRDAWAAFVLYCVVIVSLKGPDGQEHLYCAVDEEKILQEFDNFFELHEKARERYQKEYEQFMLKRQAENFRRFGCRHPKLRQDVDAPAYGVFAKWKLTEADKMRIHNVQTFAKPKEVTHP